MTASLVENTLPIYKKKKRTLFDGQHIIIIFDEDILITKRPGVYQQLLSRFFVQSRLVYIFSPLDMKPIIKIHPHTLARKSNIKMGSPLPFFEITESAMCDHTTIYNYIILPTYILHNHPIKMDIEIVLRRLVTT